jgi:tetratricopeptide (TPR) repeat protein
MIDFIRLTTLSNVIHYYKLAVGADPVTHTEYAEIVGNLGATYFEMYERDGKTSDLDQAINYAKLAVESEYRDKKHEPKMLDSLARMYHKRFLDQRAEPSSTDLQESIRLWKLAIESTPPQRQEVAQFYSNLGTSIEALYEGSNDTKHLEEAAECWSRSVNLTSENDKDKASRATKLGHGYNRMFHHTTDESWQRKALDMFLLSLHHPTGTPLDRVLAGLKAANIAEDKEDWNACTDYLTSCIELLPRITMPSNSQEDLEHTLRQLAGLGPRAAVICLRAGRSFMESLYALDRCRTVIGSLMINSRSDISLLEERFPDLAAEYKRLRHCISRGTLSSELVQLSNGPQTDDHTEQTEKRLRDIHSLDEVLSKIRGQPDFERFQLALSVSDILDLARFGPLVYFNATSLGSPAFLVNDGCVEVLELPLLHLGDLNDAITINFGSNGTRRDINRVSKLEPKSSENQKFKPMAILLSWLWDVAIGPVLRKLDIKSHDTPTSNMTHIWWVGGGPMALLPLHAAGRYSDESTDNSMSAIASTYATSLKTLHYPRMKTWKPLGTNSSKIMVVAMPTTHGRSGPG